MPPKKDKSTGLNKKYVPNKLTPSDKKKQVQSIKEEASRTTTSPVGSGANNMPPGVNPPDPPDPPETAAVGV